MSFPRGQTSRFVFRWRTARYCGDRVSRRRQRAGIAAASVLMCLATAGGAQEGAIAARDSATAAQESAPAAQEGAVAAQAAAAATQVRETRGLALAEAVEIALAANPHFASTLAQARALQEIPPQAGALPDPMVGLNAMNLPIDSFRLDREPMTQLQVTFSQAIPFPGNRRLMEDAARYEADAGFARVEGTRLTLAARVRTAWWRLFQQDRALEIVAQNQALMRDFIEIAQTRYRVGNGLQQDVLLAQLELSRLLDRELRLAGMRAQTEAALAALLDSAPGEAIRLPPIPGNVALPDVPAAAELVQAAVADHPALTAENALVGAARARLDLSERYNRPNFSLGAGYGYRRGADPFRGGERSDFVSVMFNVTVPLYAESKQRRAIEQRTHEVTQREFSFRHALGSIQAAIAGHRADYEAAREQVSLLETAIIPQAQQTVTSMLAAYQVNQVDFLNVLNTQITLYNSQVEYWEALGRAKAALAQLAASAGMEALYE